MKAVAICGATIGLNSAAVACTDTLLVIAESAATARAVELTSAALLNASAFRRAKGGVPLRSGVTAKISRCRFLKLVILDRVKGGARSSGEALSNGRRWLRST